MPAKITTSEILSKDESRKAPFLDVCFVTRATLPSTMSKKPEIKKAVEFVFNVKVENVRVVRVKGKAKRFGRVTGKRQSWKKAFVALKEGFDINFANME